MRTLLSAPPTSRVGRYPKHTFQTKELPFSAQPFFIAPVLPAETLDNMYFEARVVSDPVLNSIIGWKKEFYFFYVRMSDLGQEVLRDMFIDPANAQIAMGDPGNSNYYSAAGAYNYLHQCMDVIVKHFFRDQDEAPESFNVGSARAVQIRERFWLDSITDKDKMNALAGQNLSAATNTADLQAMQDAFEQLRALGMANMTYEDFLRSYGIAVPGKDENAPELLARFSDFQYPSNTINPENGSPSSALSWVFKNGSKSPKFFKEPGFLVGVSVTRPKVYFSGLSGTLTGFMTRAWDWLPNYMNEAAADPMPETSLKYFGPDTGPLGNRSPATDGYWLDMRDLFIHGDQFQNMVAFPNDGAPANSFAHHMLALPPSDDHHQYKYPTEAMAKGFFLDAAGTKTFVRQDGYVSLSIKGRQVDYTQTKLADV